MALKGIKVIELAGKYIHSYSRNILCLWNSLGFMIHRELEQIEPILSFQVPVKGLEMVILLHTQY